MGEALADTAGIEIPDKVFFRIGEVADLTGVKAYVLRFWEKEFPSLKPKKSRSGQRLFRRADIEEIARIKSLLWDRRFTIEGARDELKRSRGRDRATGLSDGTGEDPDRVPTAMTAAPRDPEAPAPTDDRLREARAELDSTREQLSALESRLAAAAAEFEASRAARARSDGEAARLASKLEESEADLSALQASHDALRERHSLLAAEHVRASAEVERLRADSDDVAPAAEHQRLIGELMAVRAEILRFKARVGARLPTLD